MCLKKLLRYEGRFESEEHLKAWLLRVAINRCRDITRAARQKDTELDENIPAPESGNDGSVLRCGAHSAGKTPQRRVPPLYEATPPPR